VTADVQIAGIHVGERHRKDLGDLQALAESIKEVGLINPITLMPDGRLIAGERRLRVFRDILGRTAIPARVLDIESLVRGEHDENELRKDFTPSERVAIMREVEAALGERRGRPKAGEIPQKVAEFQEDRTQRETRTQAAKTAGFGNHETGRQAKKVVADGIPELVEAMDTGEVSISAAAKVAALPKEEQEEILSPAAEEGLNVIADVIRGKIKMSEVVPPQKRPKVQAVQAPERHPRLDAAIFFTAHCQDLAEFVEGTGAELIADGLDDFPNLVEEDLLFMERAKAGINKVTELYNAKHSKGEQGAGGRGAGKRAGPQRSKDRGQDNKGPSPDRDGKPSPKGVRRGAKGGNIGNGKRNRQRKVQ
jgi:ParB-like chromosome segregation protein Spo0J